MNRAHLLLLATALGACSRARESAPAVAMSSVQRDSAKVSAAPASPGGAGSSVDSRASAQSAESVAPEPKPPQPPREARLLHYNGYAKLSVESPRVMSERAVALVTEAKGFVEQLNESSVTLRVPVESFHSVFRALLKLGDVIEKSVTAEDVTEAYGAVALRLQAAKTSRDRLIGLLARAKTEREKLDLLREISRLNQEIENLEGASRTLLSLSRFSRITLTFENRRRDQLKLAEETIAAFQWIHQLSPFRRDVAEAGKRLKMQVPVGLVLLDEKKRWISESADGCVYWASERENEPKGDGKFWRDAVKARLGPDFAEAEEKQVGAFYLLRLVERADDAYRYFIGVRADGDKLQVVEAHFPTLVHEKQYAEAILASIAKGGE